MPFMTDIFGDSVFVYSSYDSENFLKSENKREISEYKTFLFPSIEADIRSKSISPLGIEIENGIFSSLAAALYLIRKCALPLDSVAVSANDKIYEIFHTGDGVFSFERNLCKPKYTKRDLFTLGCEIKAELISDGKCDAFLIKCRDISEFDDKILYSAVPNNSSRLPTFFAVYSVSDSGEVHIRTFDKYSKGYSALEELLLLFGLPLFYGDYASFFFNGKKVEPNLLGGLISLHLF